MLPEKRYVPHEATRLSDPASGATGPIVTARTRSPPVKTAAPRRKAGGKNLPWMWTHLLRISTMFNRKCITTIKKKSIG